MIVLVGKVREYVFHILCSECWDFLVGGREGNEHFKSSNSRLNNLSVSQSLSLSPGTFYPALLNSQKKTSPIYSDCPGPILTPFLALGHVSCPLDLH